MTALVLTMGGLAAWGYLQQVPPRSARQGSAQLDSQSGPQAKTPAPATFPSTPQAVLSSKPAAASAQPRPDLPPALNLDEAIQGASAALQRDPQAATAYADRGLAYLRKGDLAPALEDLRQALRLQPQYAPALARRGRCYGLLGELDKAMEDCEEALRLAPRLAEAYFARGQVWERQGEAEQALQDYQEALRHDAQAAEVHAAVGLLAWKQQETARALEAFDRALALGGLSPALLAQVLQQREQARQAKP